MRLLSGAFTRALLMAGLPIFIAACGGGGGSASTGAVTPPVVTNPTPTPPPSTPGEEVTEHKLSGSVGDGPLVGAVILVFNASGANLAEYVSDETATYTVTIKEKGSEYPLMLRTRDGTDLVTGGQPDFSMSAAVLRPARSSRSNINPHGTLMVETASRMPGGVAGNLDTVRPTVVDHLNFGLDPSSVPDPLTTEVSDANIAVLVKASEAFGEMVRRTRDTLGNADPISGDRVVGALASDMTDGRLDGRGAAGADPRIAAIANIASAQVLVEALQNELQVNGFLATQRMDDAIRAVRPTASSTATTESVTANAEMLSQARLVVDAARALSRAPVLDDLRVALQSLQPGARPSDVSDVLPQGWSEGLTAALQAVTFGSDEAVEIVNATVRTGTSDSAPPTTAPGELSFPETSHQVVEGGQARVRVERSISEGPAWVDYEYVSGTAMPEEDYAAAPGRLPFADGQNAGYITVTSVQDTAVEDAETFQVHLVAASDGSHLGASTIASVTVADDDAPVPAVGNATLRWTPPTEREDGSTLENLAGYKVRYGLDSIDLENVITLENPGLTSYMVENLHPGTWYFAVTAFDADGRESDFSNVGSKLIM